MRPPPPVCPGSRDSCAEGVGARIQASSANVELGDWFPLRCWFIVRLDAVKRVVLGDRLRLPMRYIRLEHISPGDETDEDVE